MFRVPDRYRVRGGATGSTTEAGRNGCFVFAIPSGVMVQCLVSDGGGWEHVSALVLVTPKDTRLPTWPEMCEIKAVFWGPEDAVVQFHPPESQYVNTHPHVLHLWRPSVATLPMPPRWMV